WGVGGRWMGGVGAPGGTGGGRREAGGVGLDLVEMRDAGCGMRGSVSGVDSFGTWRLGLAASPASRISLLASRFAIPVSRVLNATSGCQPTVRIPRAESANSPTSVPPAVPTAWWTP